MLEIVYYNSWLYFSSQQLLMKDGKQLQLKKYQILRPGDNS